VYSLSPKAVHLLSWLI